MNKLLTLMLTLSLVFANMGCAKADEPENADGTTAIVVTIGDKTFEATVDNTPTGEAFLALLPMTLQMNELNGNEKYGYLSTNLPTNTYVPGTIYAGDLFLYGSNCLVLFYETFSSGYSYSRIGRIIDPSGLEEAVGSGNVTVSFAVSHPSGLEERQSETLQGQAYNLLGQPVPENYHGIVIRNGKKIFQQ